ARKIPRSPRNAVTLTTQGLRANFTSRPFIHSSLGNPTVSIEMPESGSPEWGFDRSFRSLRGPGLPDQFDQLRVKVSHDPVPCVFLLDPPQGGAGHLRAPLGGQKEG